MTEERRPKGCPRADVWLKSSLKVNPFGRQKKVFQPKHLRFFTKHSQNQNPCYLTQISPFWMRRLKILRRHWLERQGGPFLLVRLTRKGRPLMRWSRKVKRVDQRLVRWRTNNLFST